MHTNYFEISSQSNWELGKKLGEIFGENLDRDLAKLKKETTWSWKIQEARNYLQQTKKDFSQYIEELEGYAQSSNVDFLDLWTVSLEDEVYYEDKCTSLISNDGKLLGHNEDQSDSEESIVVLKKTIKDMTILELYYLHTLGGNSVSINSHGYIQAIDSLTQTDKQLGVPRNVIARWMSETRNPKEDLVKLESLNRASGFCHNILSVKEGIMNIETTAKKVKETIVTAPFVHSNNYLTELNAYEANDNSTYTFERYKSAKEYAKDRMTVEEMKVVLDNSDNGKLASIYNERTVASIVVDLEENAAYIRLAREQEKSYVKYNLDFITK